MADLSAGIEILTKEEFLEYTDLDKMDISVPYGSNRI
jgi:hypothetical protein